MAIQPFSSDNGFITAGNITGNSLVSTGNISTNGGGINGGTATVVTDGINSIALSLGATMDVFGFPFTTTPTRGQLTITGAITTTEALGTWYYQSVNSTTYQLYTDSTYSTLVDASGWTAYAGGGEVDITLQTPPTDIVINSNGFTTTFANNGDVTLPGSLTLPDGVNSVSNLTITADTQSWTFDNTGNLTIPGTSGGLIKTVANASIGIAAMDDGTDNPAQLMSWNVNQANPSTIVSTYANSATIMTDVNGTAKTWTFSNTGNLSLPTTGGFLVVTTGIVGSGASPAPTLSGFSNVSALTLSASGNITGGNIFGGSIQSNAITANGMTINGNVIITGNANVQGNLTYNNITNLTTSNLVLGLGNNQSGVNVTGGGVVVGNTNEAALLYNFATQSWVSNIAITSNANVTGGNIRTAGQVTATGNVTGGNIITAGNATALNLNVTTSIFSGIEVVIGNTANANAQKTRITTAGANSFIQTGNGTVGTSGNVIFSRYFDPIPRVSIDTSSGNVSAAGNVSANVFIGNGSLLTNVTPAPVPAFSATGSTSITGTGGFNPVVVIYNAEELDTNNWFASNRFTPQRAGWYQINCGARVYVTGSTPSTESYLILRKNGAQLGQAGGFGSVSQALGRLVYLNGTTDYVDVAVLPILAGTITQGSGITYFNGYWVQA